MFVLAALLSLASCSQALSDRDTLLRFYIFTNGKRWFNSTGWQEAADGADSEKSPVCSWYGVTCEQDAVTGLDLSANNLKGKVAHHLWAMPSLTSVNLGDNLIEDASFEGLEDGEEKAPIKEIILADNELTSLAGIEFASETLRTLRISSNDFDRLPQEIFQLKHLKSLDVADMAGMTGTLSTMIGNLVDLRELHISYTSLKGTIPSEIGLLTKLELLIVDSNKLHGPVPAEMENLVKLHTLSMENPGEATGRLTGPLPSFKDLTVLGNLYLDHNALTGTIPTDFLENSVVTNRDVTVRLSNNKLSGKIPQELGRFEKLHLEVQGNKINGIPNELCGKNKWMFGQVADFGCDAILCPKGSFAESGRRESADVPCEVCPGGTDDAPHLGSIECGAVAGKAPLPTVYSTSGQLGGGAKFCIAVVVVGFVFSFGLALWVSERRRRSGKESDTGALQDNFDAEFNAGAQKSDMQDARAPQSPKSELQNVPLEEEEKKEAEGLYV